MTVGGQFLSGCMSVLIVFIGVQHSINITLTRDLLSSYRALLLQLITVQHSIRSTLTEELLRVCSR